MADDGLPMQIRYNDCRAVGGVGAGGRVMPRHTAGLPTISVTALDDRLEQHKGPRRGGAPVPLARLVGRLVRRAQFNSPSPDEKLNAIQIALESDVRVEASVQVRWQIDFAWLSVRRH